MTPQYNINKRKLLLGEGTHEVAFFEALLDFLQIRDVQVMSYGGRTNLIPQLRALRATPGFADVISLGITRDADLNANAALQSLKGALAQVGLPDPAGHNQFKAGTPKVGVFVMPDGKNNGALEDLFLRTVPKPELVCIGTYYGCLGRQPAGQQMLAKGKVHAWLASQTDPDVNLGTAAKKGYVPFADPEFADLSAFLIAL